MRYLEVIDYDTGKCVKRIDVTDKSDRQIEKLERGILLTLNSDQYFIGDTFYDHSMTELNA